MSSALSIIAGQSSEKGAKERNEDSCAIRVPTGSLLKTKGIVIAIADGVSSSMAGREASETCVKSLMTDYYSTPDSWTVKTSCQKVLGAINRWLYGQSQNIHHHEGHGMLTTLSALVLKSSTGHIFHVGDSRVYRLRGVDFERLTRDHHRWGDHEKAFLSRAMGADVNVEIDYRSIDLEPNDIFLLTTDGVHEFVRTPILKEIIQKNYDNPEKAAREIITAALKSGSDDNVSCQVCRIEHLPHLDEESFYKQLTELPFPPPLEEGMLLDGYKIIREIHASQRTQVYLALDVETNGKVIVKTPSVNYDDDPGYIDGFLNEEWAGRRINSPHVLKIVDPKRQRKFLYYVTEYIEGVTLRVWMNEHRDAKIGDVRDIIKQIAAGIRAFQRQEMVHQDLKPENILIDTNGTVKIVDFGSTKIAGIAEINKPYAHNMLLGTVDYAAPEYFKGYVGTHLSDIYSLGVIAYEMLSGKLPYGKPLSERTLNRAKYIPLQHINSAVPAWIDAAIEKAVKLNPQRRYAALSEFMEDLDKPNNALVRTDYVPLIERNPVKFWQVIALLLLMGNMILGYYLVK